MKPILILSILFLLTFVDVEDCLAQPDVWTVITIVPDTLHSCLIGDIEDNRVSLIRTTGEVVRMSVDSIGTLVRKRGSQFWSGAGYGALIGGGAGVFLGAVTYEEPSTGFQLFHISRGGQAFLGGMFGSLSGLVVGGLIGAASGGEERYDISDRSVENKRTILRQLGEGNQNR